MNRSYPQAPMCSRCFGCDRRLWTLTLPDGTTIQECCATPDERGPEETLGPSPFPADVLTWVSETLAKAPHESLTDEECMVVAVSRMPVVTDEYMQYVVIASALYEAQKPKEPKSGAWVPGAVGERVTRGACQCLESRLLDPVTLDNGIRIQSTLCKFRTAEGEDLVWFASGKFIPEQGHTYTLTFTIKKLDCYEGHRSTIITRAKPHV